MPWPRVLRRAPWRTAALLAAVTWPRRDARPDPPRRAPSEAAATAAVFAHERGLRRAQVSELRWLPAELDGRPPAEAVVAAVVTRPTRDPEACDYRSECPERRLWVVGRVGGRHRVIAARSWPYSPDSGTFDVDPGFTEVATERVIAPGVDALRVGYEVAQGGRDPRYYGRVVELVRLSGGRLATIFRCALQQWHITGAARAGVVTTRSIAYDAAWPRGVTVEVGSAYHPGWLDDPEQIAEDRRERGFDPAWGETDSSGAYVFREGRYHPVGEDVCGRGYYAL